MNRIKELRLSSDMTQYELAYRIGLNQTAIGKYERGELEPSISTLKKLSEIFECSIDYIVGHSDDFGAISIKNEKPALALSQDEQKLLETYRKLNTKNKIHVATYADIRLEEQDDVPPSISRKKI